MLLDSKFWTAESSHTFTEYTVRKLCGGRLRVCVSADIGLHVMKQAALLYKENNLNLYIQIKKPTLLSSFYAKRKNSNKLCQLDNFFLLYILLWLETKHIVTSLTRHACRVNRNNEKTTINAYVLETYTSTSTMK